MVILAVLGFLGYWVLISVIGGGTLDVFWDWFIRTPNIWPDAPDLTIGSALGLMLVVGFLTQSASVMRGDNDDISVSIGKGLLYYAIIWAVALVYHVVLGIGS